MQFAKLKVPLIFAATKLIFHFFTNTNWGFHRDEFLYIALGQHLDWGFWSNPPFTGFISWLGQNTIGDGQGSIRFLIALFSAATVFLCCLMAKELGGKNYAQILTGIAASTGTAAIRSGHLFQPVGIDIFFWALSSYFLIRFLKSENGRYLLYLGLTVGFGFLNKYSIAFLLIAMAIGLLITPARKIFKNKYTWFGTGLALLIVSPNLIWQWANNFPVLVHMQELSENQLSTIEPINFLMDQFSFHLLSVLVWLPGLYFLLFKKEAKPYRALGWFTVSTVIVFLLMSGKSYYTLGIFPVLIGAGGVFWEQLITNKWMRWGLATLILVVNLIALPIAIPIYNTEKTVTFFKDLGVESFVRGERGNIESLPQDYADMLGWEEIAKYADEGVDRTGKPETCLIYSDNYGQAGAIKYYGKYPDRVVSFSDSYKLWMPNQLDKSVINLIYINDELGEDVAALFNKVELIGTVNTPHARERGTQVYLCQAVKTPFKEFWEGRVRQVKDYYGMD